MKVAYNIELWLSSFILTLLIFKSMSSIFVHTSTQVPMKCFMPLVGSKAELKSEFCPVVTVGILMCRHLQQGALIW